MKSTILKLFSQSKRKSKSMAALENIAFRITKYLETSNDLVADDWKHLLFKAFMNSQLANQVNDTDHPEFLKGLQHVQELGLKCYQDMVPVHDQWWGSVEQQMFLIALKIMLDFEGHPFSLVVVCPGPESKDGTTRLKRAGNKVDLIIEAYKQAGKWCQSFCEDIADTRTKINAHVAAKTVKWGILSERRIRKAFIQAKKLM